MSQIDDQQDKGLLPTTDQTPLNNRPEPGVTDKVIQVPQDELNAGHDTNEPRDDSPESLDEELSKDPSRKDVEPQLPEDQTLPFSVPTDPIGDDAADLDVREQELKLDPAHQDTDNATDIDTQQEYDEGLGGAAVSSEPNAGNTVVDYDPAQDQRHQTENT